MQGITSGEAMNQHPEMVTMDMFEQLMEEFVEPTIRLFQWLMSRKDSLESSTSAPLTNCSFRKASMANVSDIAETLDLPWSIAPIRWLVLRHLEEHGGGCVPVIKSEKDPKLLGVLRRIDIIRAYNKVVTRRRPNSIRKKC